MSLCRVLNTTVCNLTLLSHERSRQRLLSLSGNISVSKIIFLRWGTGEPIKVIPEKTIQQKSEMAGGVGQEKQGKWKDRL